MSLRRMLGLLMSNGARGRRGRGRGLRNADSRPVSAVLPAILAKGPFHTVRDPVVDRRLHEPLPGQLELRPLKRTGTGALRKLVHELWAIGELQKSAAARRSSSAGGPGAEAGRFAKTW